MRVLVEDVSRLKEETLAIALELNEGKCEFITSSAVPVNLPSFDDFKKVSASNATLLGSSLLRDNAMESSLKSRVDSLSIAASRLQHLQSHDALLILRHSLRLHFFTFFAV